MIVRTRFARGGLVVLAATALAVLGLGSVGPEREAPPTGVVGLGPTDPGARVDFSLVLAQPGRAALRRYLRALDDPRARDYHRYLTAGEFGRRFGVSDRALARVRSAVAAGGLRVIADYPQRTSLGVRGTAASVGRFLNTRFVDYRDAQGRRFHAPARSPTLPRSLAGTVVAAAGLDNRPRLHPSAIPKEGLKPADTAAAYNIAPLHEADLRGQGQSVAIVSFSGFDERDVAEFDRRAGIREAPPVRRVRVREGATTDPGGEIEVNLDIDVVRGIAPLARIYNYESPNGIGFAPAVDQIVDDGRAKVISISWGMCDSLEEEPELAQQRVADQRAFEAAVTAGISVFAASGDNGAYDCQSVDPRDHRLSVDYPASSQFVIGVGGTLLSVRENGSYAGETGWQETLSGGGSGGGLSTVDARPEWQRGPGVDNDDSNGKRQIPDVAASADSDSGFFVFAGGVSRRVGGTSAAAPLWAGSTLLIAQLAKKRGARPVGFLAPLLYRLAESPDPPFHDVVRGGNRHFDASPGWDYVTGLGTPDVARLADSVTAELQR